MTSATSDIFSQNPLKKQMLMFVSDDSSDPSCEAAVLQIPAHCFVKNITADPSQPVIDLSGDMFRDKVKIN